MGRQQKTGDQLLVEVRELRRRVAALRKKISAERQVKSPRGKPGARPNAVTSFDTAAWERAFDAIPVPLMMIGMGLRIDWMNRAMAQLCGIRRRESVGKPCYQVIHGEEGPPAWCPHTKVLEDGETHSAVIKGPGFGRTFAVRASALLDTGGRMIGSVHVIIDLTEQKRAENALAESEERFRGLLDGMNEGFGIQDSKGVITYVNDKLCTMWGYSRDEVIGRRVDDFLDDENRRVLRTQMAGRKAGGIKPYELEWTGREGRRVPTLMAPKPIIDPEGRYVGSFAVLTDLTDRKRTENELRESEERYRNLVDLSPDGIHVNVGGRVAFANAAMASLLGVTSPDELIGGEVLDLIHPGLRDVVRERIHTTLSKSEPVPLIEEKYVRG